MKRREILTMKGSQITNFYAFAEKFEDTKLHRTDTM